MTMHFRQRVAWLLLAIYLLLTASVLYYMFEISAQLRMFALDHVDRVHTIAASPLRPPTSDSEKPVAVTSPSIVTTCVLFLSSVLGHVVDIPTPVLAVLIFTVYIQIFCVLWMYTRPEVNCLSSCFWPARLYTLLKSRSIRSAKSPPCREQKNSPNLAVSNGMRTVVMYEL